MTKRLVRTPKLYFLDTGLCSWLTEWTSPGTLEAGAASGALLETWIFGEILKSWLHHGRRPPFQSYRDKDQKELDLLIVQDDAIYPLEFRKSASPDRDTVRPFRTLANLDRRVGPGAVVCLTGTALPLAEGVLAIPVGAI